MKLNIKSLFNISLINYLNNRINSQNLIEEDIKLMKIVILNLINSEKVETNIDTEELNNKGYILNVFSQLEQSILKINSNNLFI